METSTLKEESAKMGFHTTLTREIRPDYNWHELMERWQAAVTLGDMLSVLHRGFDVSLKQLSRWGGEKDYDEIDRLTFYFTIADGWADHYHLLELPEDRGKEYQVGCDSREVRKTPSELRQELARMAFDMLCRNFFKAAELWKDKNYPREGFNRIWESQVVSERFFPIIQNFFSVQKDQFSDRVKIRNLSRREEERSHNERLAIDFIVNLARFLWEWQEPDDEHYYSGDDKKKERREYLTATRRRIDAARPWIVEILDYLQRLDLLQKWILKFDKACLAKLKEIALRGKLGHPYFKCIGNKYERLVATLDEACLAGSPAAWFLKKHELMTREHKRLTTIREAEQQIEEAGRQIEKLAAVK